MCGEFFAGVMSCGHGDGDSSKDFAALDVARGVTDDIDVIGREGFTMESDGAGLGDGAEFVADVVIIGKSSKGEVVPDSVVSQFDFGTSDEIACKECQKAVGAFLQSI